jgi:hypothetical protein
LLSSEYANAYQPATIAKNIEIGGSKRFMRGLPNMMQFDHRVQQMGLRSAVH